MHSGGAKESFDGGPDPHKGRDMGNFDGEKGPVQVMSGHVRDRNTQSDSVEGSTATERMSIGLHMGDIWRIRLNRS